MNTLIIMLVLFVLVLILAIVVYGVVRSNIALKIEIGKLKRNIDNTIEKEKKRNELRKEELHTGNSADDFNSSISLLQEYSKRS